MGQDWERDFDRERERPLSDLSDVELLREGRRLRGLGIASDSDAAIALSKEVIRRGWVEDPRAPRVEVLDLGPSKLLTDGEP